MSAEKKSNNRDVIVPKTFEEAVSQIALLSETARVRENELDELQGKVARLEEDLRAASEALTRNEGEKEKTDRQKSHEHEKRRLHLLKERELKKALSEKDRRIAELEGEIEDLKNQWPENASQEIPALFPEELARLRQENGELAGTVASLREELAASEAKAGEIESRNAAMAGNIQLLNDSASRIDGLAVDSETKKFIGEELETILFKIDELAENVLDEGAESEPGAPRPVESETKDRFKKLIKIIARDEIMALLTKCEAETRHLKAELEKLSEASERSAGENEKLSSELAGLAERYEKSAENERALSDENKTIARELKERSAEAERLSATVQRLGEEIENQRKTKNLNIEEKSADLKRLSEKCRELTETGGKLALDLSEARKAREEAESKLEALRAEHEKFPALLQSKIAQIEQLEAAMAELRLDNAGLASKASGYMSDLAVLNSKHEELHGTKAALEKLVEEKNAEVARLSAEPPKDAAADEKLKKAAEDLDAALAKIEKLRGESEALGIEAAHLKEINASLIEAGTDLAPELEAAKKRISELEADAAAWRDSEKRFGETVAELKAEGEGLREGMLLLENENSTLQEKAAGLEKKCRELEAAAAGNAGAEAETRKLTETIALLENQYNGALAEISGMKANIDSLSKSLDEITNDLASTALEGTQTPAPKETGSVKVSAEALFLLEEGGEESEVPAKILDVIEKLGIPWKKATFNEYLFGDAAAPRLAVFASFEKPGDAPRLFEAAESSGATPLVLYSSVSGVRIFDCMSLMVSGVFADFIDLSASGGIVETAVVRALEKRVSGITGLATRKDESECKLRESVLLGIDGRSKSNRIEELEKRVTFLKENNRRMKENLRLIREAFDGIVGVITELDLAGIPAEIAVAFDRITSTLLKITSIK